MTSSEKKVEKVNTYLKREDPTEEEVNILIDLGYSLISITPVTKEFKKPDRYISLESVLVYHFILKPVKKEK
jgi:hypothetical protein